MNELPTPLIAKRARELQEELTRRDPHLKCEIAIEPSRDMLTDKCTTRTVVYSSDHAVYPARMVQWEVTDLRLGSDRFAATVADGLLAYWQRRRDKARGPQG